jgi:hygromycin-B 7''-O-kinase
MVSYLRAGWEPTPSRHRARILAHPSSRSGKTSTASTRHGLHDHNRPQNTQPLRVSSPTDVPESLPDRLTLPIAEAMGRLIAPVSKVKEVVLLLGGQISTVYEVRCAQPDQSLIVKFYSEKWHWKQAKEVHVFQLLAQHNAGPVPLILRAEPAGDLLGCPFTVMTRLEGQPLAAVSAQLDDVQLHGIYRQLGKILGRIHSIGQEAYGFLTTAILEPEPTNSAYMTRQFARKLNEFIELGGDPALHSAIKAHVSERTELFAHCLAPVLCHNDFHENNVLVTEGPGGWTVTGFIDVENATAADPLIDLAKTNYYAIKGNSAKLSGLIEGYGPLPADWRERLALYRLYHALELWDWFASVGNTTPLPGIGEDIRRFLAS